MQSQHISYESNTINTNLNILVFEFSFLNSPEFVLVLIFWNHSINSSTKPQLWLCCIIQEMGQKMEMNPFESLRVEEKTGFVTQPVSNRLGGFSTTAHDHCLYTSEMHLTKRIPSLAPLSLARQSMK